MRPMDDLQAQLYGVLAAQGIIWVLGHCPAMCGPLMIALRFHGVSGVLAYQAGKAVTYAILGAIAGSLGGVTIFVLRDYAPWLLGLTAVVMIGLGLHQLRGRGVGGVAAPAWLLRVVQRHSVSGRTSIFRVMIFGSVLALLPCAVVVWALGLAVASASPIHGAGLMVGLVLLNTPVLVAAHWFGAAAWMAGVRHHLRWLPPLGLIFAGAWLGWLAMTVGAPGCLS